MLAVNAAHMATLRLHIARGECLTLTFMPDACGMLLITGELVTPLLTLRRGCTVHPRDLLDFSSRLVDGVRAAARARSAVDADAARIGEGAQP